jgi:hypothetical protein
MNLYYFTVTTAFLMGVMGLFICSKPKIVLGSISGLIRSKKAAIFFLVVGLIWFLYEHVQNLGEADFGDYKYIIGFIAAGVAISSYFFISDFLSVRAFCILVLLYSREVLDSAFVQDPQTRLFLVSVIYCIIILSLYFGAWPYRARDLIKWFYSNIKRTIILGAILVIYSVLLFVVSFSY